MWRKMQRALPDILVGEHDFKSFCTAKPEVTNTVRTVYSLDLKRERGHDHPPDPGKRLSL